MNDLADKQNLDQPKKKKYRKIGLVLLLIFLGFTGFCGVFYLTHRAALEDSYHGFTAVANKLPIGEIIAAHLDQNPQKAAMLSHLDAQLYAAELYALKKDYPKMHETFSDATQTARELFGPKSDFLRFIYIAQANHECDFNKWGAAIDAYSHAIDINSNDSVAYACRARAYYEKYLLQASIDDLTKAIALDPKTIGLFRFRAQEYEKLGNYKEALADYDTILTFDPNDKQALRWRRYINSRLQNLQK